MPSGFEGQSIRIIVIVFGMQLLRLDGFLSLSRYVWERHKGLLTQTWRTFGVCHSNRPLVTQTIFRILPFFGLSCGEKFSSRKTIICVNNYALISNLRISSTFRSRRVLLGHTDDSNKLSNISHLSFLHNIHSATQAIRQGATARVHLAMREYYPHLGESSLTFCHTGYFITSRNICLSNIRLSASVVISLLTALGCRLDLYLMSLSVH